MKCALLEISTNTVVNMIMCESHDPVPEGYMLIDTIPDWVDIGNKTWNGKDFGPNPKLAKPIPGLDMV